jgi:hypothetical protein
MSLSDPIKLARTLKPPQSLREFSGRLRTETDCEEFLFQVRYPEGFVSQGMVARNSSRAY